MLKIETYSKLNVKRYTYLFMHLFIIYANSLDSSYNILNVYEIS